MKNALFHFLSCFVLMSVSSAAIVIDSKDDPQHLCLFEKATEVADTPAAFAEALHIAEQLKATLAPLMPAAGLAAPQIGISKRVFIFSWDRSPEHLVVAINPKIEMRSRDTILNWEACFSEYKADAVWAAEVPRARRVIASYLNEKGERVSYMLSEFAARVFQHECDHLDGVLNTHINNVQVRSFASTGELKAFIQASGQVPVYVAPRLTDLKPSLGVTH